MYVPITNFDILSDQRVRLCVHVCVRVWATAVIIYYQILSLFVFHRAAIMLDTQWSLMARSSIFIYCRAAWWTRNAFRSSVSGTDTDTWPGKCNGGPGRYWDIYIKKLSVPSSSKESKKCVSKWKLFNESKHLVFLFFSFIFLSFSFPVAYFYTFAEGMCILSRCSQRVVGDITDHSI